MANIVSGCYECSRNCINDQFCEQDGSISLPKQLKIKVIANPTFWGFDDGNGNVLTSGVAIFSNGHYDFFDGYDQYHFATKECTPSPVEGPYKNEQRPDVLYRTVLDPDDASLDEYSGRRHYGAGGTVDNINRGGGEVYLIDRIATATTDLESCDTSDPTSVYKKFPENFGYGTKISLTDTVFKNKTGAWRYIDIDDCNTTVVDTGIVSECDRTPKQEILRGATYGTEYDPFQIRVSGDRGCLRDGSIPDAYTGTSTFYRSSGVTEFIELRPLHSGIFASGLRNGSVLGLYGDYLNATHTIFDLTTSGCKLVGTLGSGYINETGLNYWTALGTYDPESCCGGVAYNVSNDTKRPNNITNYHADLGRIFNNSKNVIQSNRFIENRYDYGFGQPVVEEPANTIWTDKSYPSISSTGIPLVGGFPVFERELPYYGAFYTTDRFDTSTRSDGKHNTTKGNNQTCYSKKSSLSVFPDCFTQKYYYQECDDGPFKYLTNQVSRLALVYKGCNYEDECYFNASGNPYIAPTSVNDLKRGLAGQEIYMYINLDEAWGAHIYSEPCACVDSPAGNASPENKVLIQSPITFPTFPKFDLYPEAYGCNDLLWQYKWASECEGAILNECPIPSSLYACNLKQPYTTYGFIRNLCGNEYHDRRQVITSAFATLVQDGDYRNTGVAPATPQPMYWNHLNPYTHESGVTGGVSASGNYPFWGLSDADGRLVAPYFRTKSAAYAQACGGTTNYLDFDLCATRASGWPTSSVPFLVEIDHTDDCIGCGSIEATQGDLVLEAIGLDTRFSHARGEKYGWNHCKYKGTSFDATYTCESGFNSPCDGLVSGVDLINAYNPYVGNTCSCINDTFQLRNIPLKDTNISAGWTTWGTNNSYINIPNCAQDYQNDYFSDVPYERLPGFGVYGSFKLACDNAHQFLIPADSTGILKNYLMMSQITGSQNVLDLMYQNAGCGHHFPSAASDLTLKSGFVLVPSGNEEIFKLIPEHLLTSLGFLDVLDTPTQVLSALADNHVFGCNTYYSEYGCASTNEYGQASFYPCGYCKSGDPTLTPMCDCLELTCDSCDRLTSVLPLEYQNPCFCDCNLQLMRKILIDFDGNETLIYSTGVLCDAVGGPTSGVVVAVSYSGEYGSIGITYINSNTQIPFCSQPVYVTAESACSWHTGPNMLTTGVYYEYEEPYRLVSGTESCDTLIPELCTGDCANDPQARAGSCGDPIPWSGVAVNSGVVVNLKSCFPEVMIVNKIECSYNSFNLYVAREYHSHARNWEKSGLVSAVPTCIPKQIGAYRYGATCVEVSFATPTDAVTPAYYSVPVTGIAGTGSYRGVCNAHYSSGIHANQDFILSETPVAVGEDKLWNYFNLFYESGYPSSKYFPAIDLGDPTNDPVIPKDACLNGTSYSDTSIFPSGRYTTPIDRFGVDWTNQFHSCLQDYVECGADFYCNKMFFPRRKYAVGTKVSRFGSLQLCTSHSSLVHGDWYTGYDDFDATEIPDDFLEAENTRFIHACDETIKTTIGSGVGLDDVVINVADYLPLIGVNTSLFRYEPDVKSCTIISSGDCHIMNMHSKLSIDGGIHATKTFLTDGRTSMGYYLDKTTTVESDNCLFNPFKILVDVECCESVLRRREIQSDPPTMLEYILDGVPSTACGGFIKQPPCSCGASTCGGVLGYFEEAPQPICITLAKQRSLYGEVASTGIDDYDYCSSDCPTCCAGPAEGSINTARVRDGGPHYGYLTTGGAVTYERGATVEPVGCPSCSRGKPIAGAYHQCSSGGQAFISSEDIQVTAYQCGDYLYVGSASITGCCPHQTLCDALSSSWKLRIGECMVLSPGNKGNYSSDYLNDCGCLNANQYTSCDTSLLHVTITEA
jgi:hypothetical protein